MAIIQPFKALRPQESLAAAIASRPYDVLNSEEAREEVKNNPNSFLRITKAEVDLDSSVNIHSTAVYEKAKENLQHFIQNNVLIQEDKACYYIYELTMEGRCQTGLECVSSVEDYKNNIIKKHEFTRPEKEQDRIDHMKTIEAQTGNVFLAYNNVAEIDTLIQEWKHTKKPTYDFMADDGIKHILWIVNDDATIQNIADLFKEKVPATYIADGHHRAASAAKVADQLPENQDAQYFLTTIFPASELAILDYNRVVKDLNGLSENDFLEKIKEKFIVAKSNTPVKPNQLHEFGLFLNHQWYVLTSKEGTFQEDPIGILDITILSENILDPILGIKDQRTDKRIDFVGGIRGIGELEKRVYSGDMKLAFSLYPVTIQQLFDIADSGNVMPPKSTWFEPKLRDGLLTHLLHSVI